MTEVAAPPKRIGRPPLDKPKASVNLRIDQDVLERWKATGPGWQTRFGQTLEWIAGRSREDIARLEDCLAAIDDGRIGGVFRDNGSGAVDVTGEQVAAMTEQLAEARAIVEGVKETMGRLGFPVR